MGVRAAGMVGYVLFQSKVGGSRRIDFRYPRRPMTEPRKNFTKSDLEKYSRYWLTRSETPRCISCHEDMENDPHVELEGVSTEDADFFFCRPCGFRFIRKRLVAVPVVLNSKANGR